MGYISQRVLGKYWYFAKVRIQAFEPSGGARAHALGLTGRVPHDGPGGGAAETEASPAYLRAANSAKVTRFPHGARTLISVAP
jgi:hypothetical protein